MISLKDSSDDESTHWLSRWLQQLQTIALVLKYGSNALETWPSGFINWPIRAEE